MHSWWPIYPDRHRLSLYRRDGDAALYLDLVVRNSAQGYLVLFRETVLESTMNVFGNLPVLFSLLARNTRKWNNSSKKAGLIPRIFRDTCEVLTESKPSSAWRSGFNKETSISLRLRRASALGSDWNKASWHRKRSVQFSLGVLTVDFQKRQVRSIYKILFLFMLIHSYGSFKVVLDKSSYQPS